MIMIYGLFRLRIRMNTNEKVGSNSNQCEMATDRWQHMRVCKFSIITA